ncbi:hypothetical protein P8S54_10005 [Thiomicrospira sp. R3]|uniref:hypothetical protein n=1 Tax=Thiomicrospira sp. R3 TaxID=3035472 RepID=UPI00259BDB32|nr:hypothetical protein [Thiomicrospira sp. R3]WFE68527.1 hypothetical protein P8S54_10005 [Thiomicrospira sp. R3]
MSYAVTLGLKGLVDQTTLSSVSLRLAGLAKLLKRSDFYPIKARDFEARTSHLFHQSATIPHAVCSAQVELVNVDHSLFWIRVDPVQLIPDRDTLVLIPASQLELTADESLSLLDGFNAHFAQDGVQLVYGSSQAWYLSLPQAVDIQTTALAQAAFRNLQGLFPQGHASGYWRKLMNEAQMLFFNHPVNQARRDRGQAEINSIWLWGEGKLEDQQIKARPDAKIWGQGSYLQGLASLTQAQCENQPPHYQAWLENANKTPNLLNHLIVLDADSQSLADNTLQSLERDWFQGLLKGLQQGEIHSLYIDLGFDQGFLLEPKYLKRVWRWRHPLAPHCAS